MMEDKKSSGFLTMLERQEALLMHKILQFSKIYPLGASAKELREAISYHAEQTGEDVGAALGSDEGIRKAVASINKKYSTELGLDTKAAPVIVVRKYEKSSFEERYNLNTERIVTRYLTAQMLMELFRISESDECVGGINRSIIESYIVEQPWFKDSIYGWKPEPDAPHLYANDFMEEKIDWLLSDKANYLRRTNTKDGRVVVTARIRFELPYIKLLCAFERSEVKVQPSPTQEEVRAIEERLPDGALAKHLEQSPDKGVFPALDSFKEKIKKFCEELRFITDGADLYRVYYVWQVFEQVVQERIKKEIFRDKNVDKIGIHIAKRHKDRKNKSEETLSYIEFRARGEGGELRKMIGNKDKLEVMDLNFLAKK